MSMLVEWRVTSRNQETRYRVVRVAYTKNEERRKKEEKLKEKKKEKKHETFNTCKIVNRQLQAVGFRRISLTGVENLRLGSGKVQV